ncbi:SUR7 family protein pun1 [Cytospora mali]|uniref:SUR7 family protein pun1 n=1 Tax=Cytospora mali TaxID=578113 RepID=A0A194VTM0_CYTMA|nr:SUR7 family protein pun1 [Valsa mali]
MRFSALGPVILGLGALILTLLCLFAGSTKSFLPEFSLITVNTSQIGENLLSSSYITDHPEVTAIIDLFPQEIQDDAEALLNAVIRRLGIHDFYTANLMTYCEGYYEPTALPNASVSLGSISKNFTYCSPRSADFQFDPRAALQRDLNASGNSWLDVTTDLDWPDEVDQGLQAVHIVQRVAFVIYCIAIGLIGLATLVSVVSVLFSGRLSACGNVLLALLAFLVAIIASALATAVAVVGETAVNHYGGDVGISATAGGKFLGLTWGATGAMLVCVVWWSVDCCCGRRGRNKSKAARGEKQGSLDSTFHA